MTATGFTESCSLSVFYIKPQLDVTKLSKEQVVPYQYSTSNRNTGREYFFDSCVVPYQYSTSNRNLQSISIRISLVVPYQYSTSNRN